MEHYKNRSLQNITEVVDDVLITEAWLPIVGHEGRYEVSNFGRIKSLGTGKNKFPVSILSQSLGDVGYPTFSLHINEKHKTYRTHRIVAQAFIENPLNKRQVNHKQAIKTDNRAWQLEWATPKENSHHAYALGVLKLPSTSWNRGEDNANSKPICQYGLDGNYIGSFSGISEAQRQTGITSIHACLSGISKTAGGYQWRYKGDKRKLYKNPDRYNTGKNHHNSKSINQYTRDGKFIKNWGGASEAGKALAICIQSIQKACKSRIPTAGGYKWEYDFKNK